MILYKLSLEGKGATVPGAGTGLGKAMCLALARAGADIVAAAQQSTDLYEQTADEGREIGGCLNKVRFGEAWGAQAWA